MWRGVLQFTGIMMAVKDGTGTCGAGRIILLFGAPGSGKGTQSALLTSRYGIAAVSTGALLREEAKRNSPSGFRLRQTLAAGALVEDEQVFRAVKSRVKALREKNGTNSAGSLILDGFPRTATQARMLDQLLTDLGMASPLVLHLDVPAEVLRTRLASRRQCATCGFIYNLRSERSGAGSRCQIDGGALVERDDDSEGVVGRRLSAYEAETLPVLDYYRRHHRGTCCSRLDGNRDPELVASDICHALGLQEPTAVAA